MGPSPYGYNLSYYYLDEEKTKTVVESLFKTENKDKKSGDNDLTQTSGTLEHENKVRLEVLRIAIPCFLYPLKSKT